LDNFVNAPIEDQYKYIDKYIDDALTYDNPQRSIYELCQKLGDNFIIMQDDMDDWKNTSRIFTLKETTKTAALIRNRLGLIMLLLH